MLRISLILALSAPVVLSGQHGYWQQHVDYRMEIDLDHTNHQFTGEQWLTYTNNSPDTIHEVFYHLYFNAFQPNSMMDTRSRNISDPDGRVNDRINDLRAHEVGFHQIHMLAQNGIRINYNVHQTVLKAELIEPLAPGAQTELYMKFRSQVPVQIRRSGRNNSEGVDYSMTQWFPKLVVYDADGWHPDPYIGREFYGDFGRYDVKITLDNSYTIGGTGVLVNAAEIGHGYADVSGVAQKDKHTWHFVAENVHDFAWAADPDFVHDVIEMEAGPTLHFFYIPETANLKNWERLKEMTPRFFTFMAHRFGEYAYPQFSTIQGGDGGMEYPMATLMLGGGDNWDGFFGLFVHEAVHNWFYGAIGTNEQRYPWMDEGFTTFAEYEALRHLLQEHTGTHPHGRSYALYKSFQLSGRREPMSTPADHFDHNRSYAISSYYMGSIFLNQLRYVIGEVAFWNGMKTYYDTWKFKHPKPADFIRVMERESGLELDWYLSYWVDLTKSIDYAIDTVESMGKGGVMVRLRRIGGMPMPVDVRIVFKDNSFMTYTIPLVMMHGHKPEGVEQSPWPWTHPEYDLEVYFSLSDIERIEIDPFDYTADMDRSNNVYPRPEKE